MVIGIQFLVHLVDLVPWSLYQNVLLVPKDIFVRGLVELILPYAHLDTPVQKMHSRHQIIDVQLDFSVQMVL